MSLDRPKRHILNQEQFADQLELLGINVNVGVAHQSLGLIALEQDDEIIPEDFRAEIAKQLLRVVHDVTIQIVEEIEEETQADIPTLIGLINNNIIGIVVMDLDVEGINNFITTLQSRIHRSTITIDRPFQLESSSILRTMANLIMQKVTKPEECTIYPAVFLGGSRTKYGDGLTPNELIKSALVALDSNRGYPKLADNQRVIH